MFAARAAADRPDWSTTPRPTRSTGRTRTSARPGAAPTRRARPSAAWGRDLADAPRRAATARARGSAGRARAAAPVAATLRASAAPSGADRASRPDSLCATTRARTTPSYVATAHGSRQSRRRGVGPRAAGRSAQRDPAGRAEGRPRRAAPCARAPAGRGRPAPRGPPRPSAPACALTPSRPRTQPGRAAAAPPPPARSLWTAGPGRAGVDAALSRGRPGRSPARG